MKYHSSQLAFSLLVLSGAVCHANPKDPKVAFGEMKVKESANLLTIETTDHTVINWGSFSIQRGETTSFIQPSCDSSVLNRVVGMNLSEIHGTLDSNGHVYLFNPHGVLVGEHGSINCASFIASTLDVLDEDFIQGRTLHLEGLSDAKVVNLGRIHCHDGEVRLIGYQVENAGHIDAHKTSLLAGREVLLVGSESKIAIRPKKENDGEKIGILQQGEITAIEAELIADGNLYSLAICHAGNLDATSIMQDSSGRISLLAPEGRIDVAGWIDVAGLHEGGEINILGKEIALVGDILLDASGQQSGGKIRIGEADESLPTAQLVHVGPQVDLWADGGKGEIRIIAEDTMAFYARARAAGEGGLIEVSGRKHLDHRGETVSDTLVLDPLDIRIVNEDLSVSLLSPFEPSAAPSTLSVERLKQALSSGDVTVQSSGSAGLDSGNVTLDAALVYDSPHSLTLTTKVEGVSSGDVQIYQPLINTGDGSIQLFSADDIFVHAPIKTSGTSTLDLLAISQVNLFSQVEGAGTGGVKIIAGNNITIGSNALESPAYVMAMNGPLMIEASSGNIQVVGGGKEKAVASLMTGDKPLEIYTGGSFSLKSGPQGGGGCAVSTMAGPLRITAEADVKLVANGATAEIGTQSGVIEILAGGSALVQGGMKGASIHSDSGGITLFSSTASLVAGKGERSAAEVMTKSGKIEIETVSLHLQGGNVRPNSFARITSDTGEILLATAADLQLVGGASERCFSEISSKKAAVFVKNIGGDLQLSGGAGAYSYAEIGVADSSGMSEVTSPLLFQNIAGDVLLVAGNGKGADARIGHAPLSGKQPVRVLGNVQFPSSGVGGNVLLSGGAGESASAHIGHGSEAATCVQYAEGDIFLRVNGNSGIQLQGGTGKKSHAVIGFVSSSHGELPFQAKAKEIHVESTNNTLQIVAGGASDALIGYLQEGGEHPTTLEVGTISLQSPNMRKIVLQDAFVGTRASKGDASCHIAIKTGDLELLGARSSIANAKEGTLSSKDIDLSCANLTIDGSLYSSHDLNLHISGAAQMIASTVTSQGDMHINQSGKGKRLTLIGGAVQSLTGKITCGVDELYVGDPAAGRPALIQSALGGSLYAGKEFSLRGGKGKDASASIHAAKGEWRIQSDQSLSLIGGSGEGSFVALSMTEGTIGGRVGGDLTLQGGSSPGSYALVGSKAPSAHCNIAFSDIGGDVRMQDAHIGLIGEHLEGSIDITGRSFSLQGAVIGFASAKKETQINSDHIRLTSAGPVSLVSTKDNDAIIGFSGKECSAALIKNIQVITGPENTLLMEGKERTALIGTTASDGKSFSNVEITTGSLLLDGKRAAIHNSVKGDAGPYDLLIQAEKVKTQGAAQITSCGELEWQAR